MVSRESKKGICTSKRFALLQSNASSKSVPIISDQLSKLEHNLLSSHDARILPRGEGLFSTLDSSFKLFIGALRYSRYQIVGSWVVEIDPLCGLRLDELIVDEVGRILHSLDLLVRGRVSVRCVR